jgi:hypothetical protein
MQPILGHLVVVDLEEQDTQTTSAATPDQDLSFAVIGGRVPRAARGWFICFVLDDLVPERGAPEAGQTVGVGCIDRQPIDVQAHRLARLVEHATQDHLQHSAVFVVVELHG